MRVHGITEDSAGCDKVPAPFVSVVIPVFNDSERLGMCLQALENQSYPRDRYEVIVVDNGSDEDVKSIVGMFGGFQVRMIREDRAGSYAARNTGLSAAKGEVIAFTDSDCIPALDWIEKGVKHLLRTPNSGLVAGGIRLFFRNPEKPTAAELYDNLFGLGKSGRQLVDTHKYGLTANLFIHRSVLERVGSFDDKLKSGGDVEWGHRVHSFGYNLLYADSVLVAHPARYSLRQTYAKAIRVGGAVHDLGRAYGHFFAPSLRRFISRVLRRVVLVSRDNKLDCIGKAKVISVMFSVIFVELLERLRLVLGGKSKR